MQLINNTIRGIQDTIHRFVRVHHDKLSNQPGSVDSLKRQVNTTRLAIRDLEMSVEKMHQTISQRYNKIRDTTVQLERSHGLSHLLSRLIRYHRLRQKLAKAVIPSVACAKILYEIKTLLQDEELASIKYVKNTVEEVTGVMDTVTVMAHKDLLKGMRGMNQTTMGRALQIQFYLHQLPESTQETIYDVIKQMEDLSKEQLKPLKEYDESTTNSSQLGKLVWMSLQTLLDEIQTHAIQVWNLQRVMAKIKDPQSNECYLDLVTNGSLEKPLFHTFWEVLCSLLQEQIKEYLKTKRSIKQMLLRQYPRLRTEVQRVFDDMNSITKKKATTDAGMLRLKSAQQTHSTAVQCALQGIGASDEQMDQFISIFEPILEEFKNVSYRRMTNPIQLMFPQTDGYHATPPSRSDMRKLTDIISHEVETVKGDEFLVHEVGSQINKAVQLYCASVENMVHSGPEAAQVSSTYAPTVVQAHNMNLICLLHQFDDTLKDLSRRFDSEKQGEDARMFGSGRELIQQLGTEILGNYLQVLSTSLEQIISNIHEDSFADNVVSDAQPSNSRYMAEFSVAFNAISREHLKRFPKAQFAVRCRADFIVRIITSFVRHASLIRPLEERGKLRLANDLTQLELLLDSVVHVNTLGSPYQELRAFRQMIFLENDALLRESVIDKIHPSNVWHHMISRGPPELQLPYQMKHITPRRYVDWMLTEAGTIEEPDSGPTSLHLCPLGHPGMKNTKWARQAEKVIWKDIQMCLDAYRQRMSAQSKQEPSSLFDLLMEAGPVLLAGYDLYCQQVY